ncbi:PREDICTED: uncharacterized protein LOC101302561 [Fragaria vesca subsp. vesca]
MGNRIQLAWLPQPVVEQTNCPRPKGLSSSKTKILFKCYHETSTKAVEPNNGSPSPHDDSLDLNENSDSDTNDEDDDYFDRLIKDRWTYSDSYSDSDDEEHLCPDKNLW